MGLSVDKINGQELVDWILMAGRDGEKRDKAGSTCGLPEKASLVGQRLRHED